MPVKNFDAAALYSAQRGGRAFAVYKGGLEKRFENQNGFAGGARDVQSLSKTFSAPLLFALIEAGLISSVDEDVFPHQWRGVTYRKLLCLQSGLPGGDTGHPISYADAAGLSLLSGTPFGYGPNAYSAFGHRVNQLLPKSFSNPTDALQKKVLTPAGIKIESWDLINANAAEPHLAGGAHIEVRELAKFGNFLIQKFAANDPLYSLMREPGSPNWFYNFCCWHSSAPFAELTRGIAATSTQIPQNGIMAAGAGNNRLIVIGDVAVARQGVDHNSWLDSEFIAAINEG